MSKAALIHARIEVIYLDTILTGTTINLTKNTLSRSRTASTFGCFQFGGDTFRNKLNKMAESNQSLHMFHICVTVYRNYWCVNLNLRFLHWFILKEAQFYGHNSFNCQRFEFSSAPLFTIVKEYSITVIKLKIMFMKSSSTGKSKSKEPQSRLLTEHSPHSRLMSKSSSKKNYARPQPIKIAQLLYEAENLKKIQKDSVRKKILPEKLGRPSTVKSSRINEKQNGISSQGICINKCVRRNLNFNDSAINMKDTNENEKKSSQHTVNHSTHTKVSESTQRRSLLLPPNTIKDKHLQKHTNETSKYSKLPQLSKKSISNNRKTDMHVYSAIQEDSKEMEENVTPLLSNNLPEKSNPSESKHIEVPKTCDTIAAPNYTSSHSTDVIKFPSECSDYPNDDYMPTESLHKDMFILTEVNSEKETFAELKDENKLVEDIPNDFQNTKLMERENNTNARCISSQTICVDIDEIICLESDLKNLLSVTEENAFKIRSTLTCITRLLSSNKIMQDQYSKENVVVNKEVQVGESKLMQQMEESLLANKLPQDDENKENNKSINVKHISDVPKITIQNGYIEQKTPIMNKKGRSLREYMALKSCMKFLETPDGKKLKSLYRKEPESTPISSRYISNKLLTNLHNLYSDTPDSN
ncbi:uncharacterized protein LOC143179559 [Calliopsis andreniformis]|uniref:uncharacterized protein LOC143179559 n=1 Tax=Calliopsis andreniformis TaxID=337506 RepID=UPI003FCD07B0